MIVERICYRLFFADPPKAEINVAKWIGCQTVGCQIQKVLGPIPATSCVLNCQAKFAFHIAVVHPAVLGTFCTNPRLDQ